MILLQYATVAVVFIAMILLLVAFHEMGHYLFARLFRAGVEEFAVGVGRPKLFTWMRRKHLVSDGSEETTEFTVRAWPVGGFVRIRGMEIRDDGSEVAVPGGFYSLAPWKRFAILLAGPVFSLFLGVAMLTALYSVRGVMRQTTKVLGVAVGSPAQKAGIRPGDEIFAIGNVRAATGYAARGIISSSSGGPMTVELVRGTKSVRTVVRPTMSAEPSPILDERGVPTGEFRRQPKIGIIFAAAPLRATVGEAFGESVAITSRAAQNVVGVFSRPAQAKENVGGVISMVAATNAVVSDSVESTIQLAALLSISVGLFNLLPIPPLDGGQMLIAAVEMFRRGRRLPMRAQLALLNMGATLLVAMIVGVLALDVSRLISPKPEPKVEFVGLDSSKNAGR